MTTLKAILTTARTVLAATPTSRDAAVLYKEHETDQPFREAPVGGADGFEITTKESEQSAGFGVQGWREWTVTMVVTLGHSPFGTDKEREDARVEDVERITDVLESATWPLGTMLVLSTTATPARPNGTWWYTDIEFTVVFVGSLRA